MYGPPFIFLAEDWGGRDIALAQNRWETHIKGHRAWINDRMIPLIRATVTQPDAAYQSDRNSQEAEVWRHFHDIKDGTPDYLKVVIRYNAMIAHAASGDIVTAYIASHIDSKGPQIWKRQTSQ